MTYNDDTCRDFAFVGITHAERHISISIKRCRLTPTPRRRLSKSVKLFKYPSEANDLSDYERSMRRGKREEGKKSLVGSASSS